MAQAPNSANGDEPDQPTRRQRLPAAERREQIVTVATKVFLEDGLGGARTKDIAEGVGVAEAILYRHFGSKNEIFEAAILDPLEGVMSKMLDGAGDFAKLDRRGRIEETTHSAEEMLRAMMQIVPLLGVALFSEQEFGAAFYQDRLVPLLEKFYKTIDDSLTGFGHPDMDPALVASVLMGSYFWIVLDAYFRGTNIDVEQVAREVGQYFVRGMTGPPSKSKP